jgi:RNA recognition motif-containing protein
MARNRLFVGNLPYSTTEEEIRALFEAGGGKVTGVRIVTDLDSGRSKGHAFVDMASEAEAQKAIQDLSDTTLNERKIVVNEARPRSSAGPPPGRRPRG